MERLRRLDRVARSLDERRYADFARARQVGFLSSTGVGRPGRIQQQRFLEWLTRDAESWMPGVGVGEAASCKIDRSGLEVLSYLAYETVGQIVEMSLLVSRRAMGVGTKKTVIVGVNICFLPGSQRVGCRLLRLLRPRAPRPKALWRNRRQPRLPRRTARPPPDGSAAKGIRVLLQIAAGGRRRQPPEEEAQERGRGRKWGEINKSSLAKWMCKFGIKT